MRLRQLVTPAGLVLALTLAVKMVAVSQLGGHPLLQPVGGLDSEHYVALARRVAAGDLLLGPGVYYLPPLYAYFLGAVFLLTGGSLLAARVVQVLLGAAAVGLVYLSARALYGRRAGLAAMALAGATGLFTFYEVLFIQAALDPFLTALALFALVRAAGAGEGRDAGPVGWRPWLLAGIALGLLALNRPNALAIAVGLAVLLLAPRPREAAPAARRSGWPAALALGAGLALAIAPVMVRNLVVSGEPVLITSHGGLNFYIGNNPEADGTYHEVPGITPSIAGQAADMRRVAEEALGRPLSDGEVSSYFYARGRSWIRDQPAAAAVLFLRKVGYTFHAAFLPLTHSYPYYAGDERTILRLLFVGPWLLIPLGLLGLAVGPSLSVPPSGQHRCRLALHVLTVVAVLYALSVAIFFVSARYRLPLLVPLCVSSAACVEWLVRRATSPGSALAAAAAGLVALAVAVNWPVRLDDGRFEERVRMVLALVASGDAGRAEELVARAGEGHPSAGLMHYRVGLAYAARGDLDAARRHHEQALRLDPGQAEIELSLGQTLLGLGRPGEAVGHLRRALDKGVRPGAARASLAQALEQEGLRHALAGNPPAAAAALESARDLEPRRPSILLNLAVVYAQMDRLDAARTLAREALALQPDYENARRFLEALR